jgi:hypothetical protein
MKRMRLLRLLGLFAVALALQPRSAARPSEEKKAPEKKEIVEFRIALDDVGDEGMTLDLRITGRKLIKELIEEPLRKARPDPDPARYQILGTVKLKYKGGSETSFVIFRPWGHYKFGDKYLIADFSGIRKAFKRAITDAKRAVDPT